MTEQDLRERFTYHAPSPDGIARHSSLTEVRLDAAITVEAVTMPGREQSLALTKLEEAKFWASAAVARNPETR